MSTQDATVGSATIERERVGLSRTLRGLVISRVRLTQLVILAVILVVWEVAGRRLGTFFLAPPSTLWAATKEMVASGDLQHFENGGQGDVMLMRAFLVQEEDEFLVEVFQSQQRANTLIERVFVDDQSMIPLSVNRTC